MTDLVLIFDTSLGDGTPEIGVNLGGTVNVTVDWGDGTSDAYTTTGYKLHTYASGGIYEVRISGSLEVFGGATTTHQAKITECRSFGGLGITSLSFAFYFASNLTVVPSSIPAAVTNASSTFRSASVFNQDIGGWDVSNVTNMRTMFLNASAFNQDLSGWCVTNITTEPVGFATGSALTEENKPVWGTCPEPVVSIAPLGISTGAPVLGVPAAAMRPITAPWRTRAVPAQSRVVAVVAQSRTATVAGVSRTIAVAAQPARLAETVAQAQRLVSVLAQPERVADAPAQNRMAVIPPVAA